MLVDNNIWEACFLKRKMAVLFSPFSRINYEPFLCLLPLSPMSFVHVIVLQLTACGIPVSQRKNAQLVFTLLKSVAPFLFYIPLSLGIM